MHAVTPHKQTLMIEFYHLNNNPCCLRDTKVPSNKMLEIEIVTENSINEYYN